MGREKQEREKRERLMRGVRECEERWTYFVIFFSYLPMQVLNRGEELLFLLH